MENPTTIISHFMDVIACSSQKKTVSKWLFMVDLHATHRVHKRDKCTNQYHECYDTHLPIDSQRKGCPCPRSNHIKTLQRINGYISSSHRMTALTKSAPSVAPPSKMAAFPSFEPSLLAQALCYTCMLDLCSPCNLDIYKHVDVSPSANDQSFALRGELRSPSAGCIAHRRTESRHIGLVYHLVAGVKHVLLALAHSGTGSYADGKLSHNGLEWGAETMPVPYKYSSSVWIVLRDVAILVWSMLWMLDIASLGYTVLSNQIGLCFL